MNGISYEEKIEKIFDTSAIRFGNWDDLDVFLEKIGLWLRCEWQCGNIKTTEEYLTLNNSASEIAIRKFKSL